MKAKLPVVLVAAYMSGGVASAHHSFAAAYLEDAQPVKIEGELVQLLFRSPHSFVHVMAPDEKGQMQRWAVEWAQGGQLERQGVTRDVLKPGDRVIVTGSPARDAQDHRLRLRKIERPLDGWTWNGNFD